MSTEKENVMMELQEALDNCEELSEEVIALSTVCVLCM